MTGKEFLNSIAKGKRDIIQIFIDILNKAGSNYCLIGGLAVNAYVEPLVSLDLDIVVASEEIEFILETLKKEGFEVEEFEHSINLRSKESDLRIQIQLDERYQRFIECAETKDVLGYRMKVAKLEDVLQGKIWAYMDVERRKSKRQKDLADIIRIIEVYPELKKAIPQSIQDKLEEK